MKRSKRTNKHLAHLVNETLQKKLLYFSSDVKQVETQETALGSHLMEKPSWAWFSINFHGCVLSECGFRVIKSSKRHYSDVSSFY